MEDELSFFGDDPGAVRFGNFINYYEFHSAESRMNLLPKELWKTKDSVCAAVDVGCNSGELTLALRSLLVDNSDTDLVDVLGVDLDPCLIARAKENESQHVAFECVDVMHKDALSVYLKHLNRLNKNTFDVAFCFSLTMWIHLNHGDDGLERFLLNISQICNILVIEPQPWKCYRSAVRRMKRSDQSFPLYADLKIRSGVENHIKDCVLNLGDFELVSEISSEWNRKIYIFKRIEK